MSSGGWRIHLVVVVVVVVVVILGLELYLGDVFFMYGVQRSGFFIFNPAIGLPVFPGIALNFF